MPFNMVDVKAGIVHSFSYQLKVEDLEYGITTGKINGRKEQREA